MAIKYFSLDTETTGVDFDNNQIIEFGAIFEDVNLQLPFNDIPKFKRIIRHESYVGSAIAIDMNARIFKILAEYEKKRGIEKEEFAKLHGIIKPSELMKEFLDFVIDCYKFAVPSSGINIAGKNFSGFDNRFIENLKRDYGMTNALKFKSRVADPATLFTNWYTDESLPSLSECKERAGVKGEVTHDAIEDAWDVIQVLRKKY